MDAGVEWKVDSGVGVGVDVDVDVGSGPLADALAVAMKAISRS